MSGVIYLFVLISTLPEKIRKKQLEKIVLKYNLNYKYNKEADDQEKINHIYGQLNNREVEIYDYEVSRKRLFMRNYTEYFTVSVLDGVKKTNRGLLTYTSTRQINLWLDAIQNYKHFEIRNYSNGMRLFLRLLFVVFLLILYIFLKGLINLI